MRIGAKLVLFDLGGVLVELTDLAPLWFGTRQDSERELWNLWLTCGLPSRMDRGELSTEDFCQHWKKLWNLPVAVEAIISTYEALIVAPFEGALELVAETAQHSEVGCLSNMNPCHWPRVQQFGFASLFSHHYVSHLIGHAKPDPEIFEHVLKDVTTTPGDIVFLDDNQLNVEAARSFGLQAELVQGVDEARCCLQTNGLL